MSSLDNSGSPSPAPAAAFLPLYRAPLRDTLIAIAGCLLIALAVHHGIIARLDGAIIGGPRSTYYVWILDTSLDDFFSKPWLSTPSFFPFTGTLAWGDLFFLPSLVGAPAAAAGAPAGVVLNLLLIAASIANGWAAYRLCYQLTGNGPAAFLGGALFMCSGALVSGGSDAPLQFAFFIPLLVSASLQVAAHRSFLGGLLLGLLFFAAFLTSLTIAIVGLITAGSFLVGVVVIHPHRFSLRDAGRIALGASLGAAPALAFLPPFLQSLEVLLPLEPRFILSESLSIPALSSRSFAVDLAALIGGAFAAARLGESKLLRPVLLAFTALLIAAIFVASFTPLSSPLRSFGALLEWLTLGAGAILLFRLGALERRLEVGFMTNRDLVGLALFSGAVCALAALGPIDCGAGAVRGGSLFDLLAGVSFGFTRLEAPRHAALGAVLGLVIGGAFTATRVLNRRPGLRFAAPVAAALFAAIRAAAPTPITTLPASSNVFDHLAKLPPSTDAVIGLPLFSEGGGPPTSEQWGAAAAPNIDLLYRIASTGRPAVNGFSTRPAPFLAELAEAARGFPSAGATKALARIAGLRHIIFSASTATAGGGKFNSVDFMRRAGEEAEALRYIDADGAGNYLFEFNPTIRLRDDFYLLVPAAPRGIVHAELQALYEANEPALGVRVMAEENGARRTVSESTVKADGVWRPYSFPLPHANGGSAPLRIRFETPPGSRLFLRSSRFIPHPK